MFESKQGSRSRDKWTRTRQQWQQVWETDRQRSQNSYDFQPQPEPRNVQQNRYQSAKKSKRMRRVAKLISPKVGKGLFTGGSIILAMDIVLGILQLIDALWMISYGMVLELISDLNAFFFLMAVGGALMYIGHRKTKKARKYREYFAIIGNQNAVSLRHLANATSTQFQDLCDDLTVLL